MKTRLMIFLLASAVAVFAQHGAGGGHGMGGTMSGGMGSSSRGMGSGNGSGSSMGHGADMGHNSSMSGSQMGKQSPDTILQRNTKLSSNLQKLLPDGTTPQQACQGFKNLGQCVAAIHVSHNLNIPFADLKTKMTGISADGKTTTSQTESLGKAIHELKPAANAKSETKKGQKQADDDLNSTAS